MADEKVLVREITTNVELARAVGVYAAVFGAPEAGDTVTVELLRVLCVTGNYVGAAFVGDEMVGFSAGLFGPPGTPAFHSHVTAVTSAARGRGVGRALKEHQARWVRERGVSTITWTFDPLVRRNAHFNLTVLGAHVVRYFVDFYGPMHDDINRGDDSDRLLVAWHLDEERGPAAAREELVTVAVPDDIEALRHEDLVAAQGWRREVREALQSALAAGGEVVGFGDTGYLVDPGGER